MRKIIINMLLFGLYGGFASSFGLIYTDYPFWAILGILVGVQINSSLGE